MWIIWISWDITNVILGSPSSSRGRAWTVIPSHWYNLPSQIQNKLVYYQIISACRAGIEATFCADELVGSKGSGIDLIPTISITVSMS